MKSAKRNPESHPKSSSKRESKASTNWTAPTRKNKVCTPFPKRNGTRTCTIWTSTNCPKRKWLFHQLNRKIALVSKNKEAAVAELKRKMEDKKDNTQPQGLVGNTPVFERVTAKERQKANVDSAPGQRTIREGQHLGVKDSVDQEHKRQRGTLRDDSKARPSDRLVVDCKGMHLFHPISWPGRLPDSLVQTLWTTATQLTELSNSTSC
jgi:hypothetical protein